MSEVAKMSPLFNDVEIEPVLNFSNPEKVHDTERQYGSKGTPEYTWSKYIQEKIVQLSYQLTRTNHIDQEIEIGNRYSNMLQEVFMSTSINKSEQKKYTSILYRTMLHTRDIIAGKGEYNLFYILLCEWVKLSITFQDNRDSLDPTGEKYDIINELMKDAVKSLVDLEDQEHGYGSWKDIKYFIQYLDTRFDIRKNMYQLPIFQYIITLVSKQLQKDENTLLYHEDKTPSLLGKWLPREKSRKFGWIAQYIACEYYSKYLNNNQNTMVLSTGRHISFMPSTAKKKCLTHYRKLLSALNRRLGTVQINQCAHSWSSINFEKSVTSETLRKQKNAFLYTSKDGYQKGYCIDRITCKANFSQYITDCNDGIKVMKGNRVGVSDLVKDALYLNTISTFDTAQNSKELQEPGNIEDLKKMINNQWKVSGKKIKPLENVIAMVDTSASMEGEPMNAAIGLGCRIAENSMMGKRIITFDASPKWIDLSETDTLTDMVSSIMKRTDWGLNTNFVAAMQLILDACVEQNMTQENISDLTLIVLSDMQIDTADENYDCMHEKIKQLFHDAGLKTTHARPYKPPHIIYWNMSCTTGFPALSTMENVSMISGYNSVMLNTLYCHGRNGLQECNAWSILNKQLSNIRYKWAEDKINSFTFFDETLVNEEAENVKVDSVENNKSWWW